MISLKSGIPYLANRILFQLAVFGLVFCFCLFQLNKVHAQVVYKGTVISENEKKPIALVTIKLQQQHRDTISNVKGIFEVHSDGQTDTLIFSHIGYDTQKIATSTFKNGQTVLLKEDNFSLSEVGITVKKQYEVLGEFSYDQANYSTKKEDQELLISSPCPIAKLFETNASGFKLEYVTLGRFVQKRSPPTKFLVQFLEHIAFPVADDKYFNMNKHIRSARANIYIAAVDSLTQGPGALIYPGKIEVLLDSYQTLNEVDLRKLNIRPPGSKFYVIIEWLYELRNQTYKIGHKMVFDKDKEVPIPKYTIGYEPFIALYHETPDKTHNRYIKQDGKWNILDKQIDPKGNTTREIALSVNISYYK